MKPLKNILLLLLLLASCGSSERGRMLAVLDEADSLNRNYIPFTTDSALKIAAEWFDSHGSANERVRAHYLLGCAYRDIGEAPAALQSYHDAVDCADTTATDCDYRLLSRVHGQMGDIFIQEYLPTQALKEYNKASAYSLYEQDTIASLLFEEAKLQSYYMLNKEDSILSLTDKLRSQYIHLGCFKQAAGVVVEQLFIYARKKKLPELKEHLDFFSSQKDLNINTYQWSNYNYLYGIYYLGYNSLDSAEYFFRKQLMTANRDITKLVLAYFGLLELYKEKKIPDSLYKYSKLYSITNDSSNIHTESTIISRMQSHYDYTRHQQIALEKSEEVSKFKSILFVVIFCVICVLYCTISIIRKYNRERREMEKQHKSDVQELLLLKNEIEKLSTANLPLIIEEKTKRIHELQSKIDEYQSKNYKKLNDVNLRLTKSEIYKHFRDYCLAPHKSEITVEDWDTLVGLLNNEVPTFFQLLTVNTQSLRKLDIYLCILVRLRFQPKDISIILDISQSEVSVLRRRLLKKIFNCDGSAKDFDKKIQSISD